MLERAEDAPSLARARALLALGEMCYGLGDFSPARTPVESAVRLFRECGDAGGEMDAQWTFSRVLMALGENAGAEKVAKEMLAGSERLRDPRRRALALERWANIEQECGRSVDVAPLLEEALALMRAARDGLGAAMLLNMLGEHRRASGDISRAAACYEESLALSREQSSAYWAAVSGFNLAVCRLRQGRPREALELAKEALAVTDAIGNRRNIAPGLALFAALAASGGKPREGAVLFGAAQRILEELKTVLVYADRREFSDTERSLRAALAPAEFEAARGSGQALGHCEAVARALAASFDFPGAVDRPGGQR